MLISTVYIQSFMLPVVAAVLYSRNKTAF